MDIRAEQIAYQNALEAVRTRPDDQELWDALEQAKTALEIAWLEHIAAKAS